MADVLDQSEVDALLAAVDSGEMDFDSSAAAGGGGGAATAAAAAGGPSQRVAYTVDGRPLAGDLSVYDFKRPERVSKDQMRSLDTLHEVFARNFQASLSAYLRTIVDVKLVSVEQLTYSEFIMSLPNPTCFNLLDCQPLEGNMILEFNPSIVYPVLDRLLGGGRTDTPAPDRAMTEIELRLISTILGRALDQLKEAWKNVVDINFKLIETESNPLLIQIVAPNEPVVLICFEVSMGESAGMINLCIPFKVIEPIMKKITTQHWFAGEKKYSQERIDTIRKNVSHALLRGTAYLAEIEISLRELMDLEVGDIIKTEKLVSDTFDLCIEGEEIFRGKLGKLRENRALRVTQLFKRPVRPVEKDADSL